MILDAEMADHQAWRDVYTAHGTELPPSCPPVRLGSGDDFDPFDLLELQLGELVDRERVGRQHALRAREILSSRTTLPGVEEFIAQAREQGLVLGVASGSERQWVVTHLERLGLFEQFDVIGCSEDGLRLRPDPEIYLSVTRALDVSPAETIAIEDSPDGIAAAKRAGLYCVSVPNAMTRSLAMDAADLVLVSLSAMSLEEVIERARRQRCIA